MPRQTPIFIITSARPRVGKTLVARAFTEYFLALRKSVVAFDINPGETKLIDFLPGCTVTAGLNDIRGEMALFDQLVVGDEIPKVIDLCHTLFPKFFALVQQLNFVKEAQRRNIALMVLFVADPDDRSRQGYATLVERFPDIAVVPVLNEAVPPTISYAGNFPPTQHGGPAVTIPALSPVVRGTLDKRTFSFIDYATKTTDGTTELWGWIRRTFVSFRDLEVRLLLGGVPRVPPIPKLPRGPNLPPASAPRGTTAKFNTNGRPTDRRRFRWR
ncbi:hypothetical protein [Rhodoplanes sp. Z2-YC6860]|uniref:hypothetical protein n=1 Tax=Rhodoplanes sp. Z2-YC6860 TaxID=674703 RepID=UPI00078E0560|nr:hypothetical protein [Rhodoplanes sp. Z2-YC6860]AMN40926.1 hypothetical protein RHPLAN_24880 [Rhodoplanes sp. Z2-YC6860]